LSCPPASRGGAGLARIGPDGITVWSWSAPRRPTALLRNRRASPSCRRPLLTGRKPLLTRRELCTRVWRPSFADLRLRIRWRGSSSYQEWVFPGALRLPARAQSFRRVSKVSVTCGKVSGPCVGASDTPGLARTAAVGASSGVLSALYSGPTGALVRVEWDANGAVLSRRRSVSAQANAFPRVKSVPARAGGRLLEDPSRRSAPRIGPASATRAASRRAWCWIQRMARARAETAGKGRAEPQRAAALTRSSAPLAGRHPGHAHRSFARGHEDGGNPVTRGGGGARRRDRRALGA
jgi:hypothetical protein